MSAAVSIVPDVGICASCPTCKRPFSERERLVTHPITGITLSVLEWAKLLDLTPGALTYRLQRWSVERALSVQGAPGEGRPGRPRKGADVATCTLECSCGARCERVLDPDLSIREALADVSCPSCGRLGAMRFAK